MDSRAWKLVSPHCDIEERVGLVPHAAKIRGLFLRSVLKVLEREAKIAAYREYFPRDDWSSLPFYPLADFLLRLAVAGAVLATPETVHLGMHQAMRQNARSFANSLIGRALLQGLDRHPIRLTEQGMAARRLTTNYGTWSITSRESRSVEVHYASEYIWIDSAVAGAAAGTYEACGLNVVVETNLVNRFNGSTRVTW